MTREEISHAIGNIGTKYIEEAANYVPREIHRSPSLWKAALIAAMLVCVLTITAFGSSFFSASNGDRLIVGATYQGDGIVCLHIENQSTKTVTLEPALKLMYYSTQEAVTSTGAKPEFREVSVPGNTKKIIQVDLNGAYDIEALEVPLRNDFYCLQITTNGFQTGQVWTCMISFRESDTPYIPMYNKLTDSSNLSSVLPSLQSYFHNFTDDVFVRWADAFGYMDLVEAVLQNTGKTILEPTYPYVALNTDHLERIPHEGIPRLKYDYDMGGTITSCFDGYNKIMGRNDSEKIAYYDMTLPTVQSNGSIGGIGLPIFYLYFYRTPMAADPNNHAFVRGNLLSFAEMEQYKVFEDDQYVGYNMTPLFYTDIHDYIADMQAQHRLYLDDIIWKRIETFYYAFDEPEEMRANLYYLSGAQRFNGTPLTLTDLIQKGTSITLMDLGEYRPDEIFDGDQSGMRIYIDENYYVDAHMDTRVIDPEKEKPNDKLLLVHSPTGDICNLNTQDIVQFLNAHQ